VGQLAEVTARLAPQGEVRVAGEGWRAELRGGGVAEVGERVRVADLAPGGLLVEPAVAEDTQAERVSSPEPGR
jgi:membrane protein implicated in regulation of membrane protease activity